MDYGQQVFEGTDNFGSTATVTHDLFCHLHWLASRERGVIFEVIVRLH